MKHAIKTVDLTKSFGRLVAVNHVGLEVDQAEICMHHRNLGPSSSYRKVYVKWVIMYFT